MRFILSSALIQAQRTDTILFIKNYLLLFKIREGKQKMFKLLEVFMIIVLGFFTGLLFGGGSNILLGGIFWALIFFHDISFHHD